MYLIEPVLFAENLRHFRERESYSIKRLAELAQLTPAAVERLEGGAATPTDEQLRRVAAALGVQATQLILPRPPEMEYYESC